MTFPDSSNAIWRKSSLSGSDHNCVEVAFLGGAVVVRDSKRPGAGTVVFALAEWTSFIDGIKNHEFDHH